MRRELTVVASDVAPVGGMELAAYEITRRLRDRGWQVTVIARSCALEPGPGLTFVRLRAPARPISIAMLVSAIQGTWLVSRRQHGLVQCHNAVLANRVDVLTLQFCERAYRREVGTPRNTRATPAYRVSAELASLIDRVLESRLLRRRARAVACVSEGLAQDVVRHYPRARAERHVIPNGVDRERFQPDPELRRRTRARLGLDEDARVAVFVGGDWHRKNLAVAIRGVAAAAGWHLLVAGEGNREHYEDVAAAAGAAERVHFLGRLADPRPAYAAADAMTFLSGYEAFSLATLEAAAMGLPILMSDINGARELVEEGVNGHLTEIDPEALADRLRALGADPGRLAAMGAASRRASARYDWDRIADAYESLFSDLGA